MADITPPRLLWRHPNPESTSMWKLMQYANNKRSLQLKTFDDLYQYSVQRLSDFWEDFWEDLSLIHEGKFSQVVDENARIDALPEWFAGVRLNYAENILFTRQDQAGDAKADQKIALTEIREGGTEIRHVTWRELRDQVGRLAQAMKAHGVVKGSRVAAVSSNSVDTLKVFLAATSLGGIFSSSSTDMGSKGILERLLQIKPQWVFMDDWSVYVGKKKDLRPKMKEVVKGMLGVNEFQGMVSLPRFQSPADVALVPRSQTLGSFLLNAKSSNLEFLKVDFKDPMLIVYSSGTTGQPKCIVHSVGGVLLSALKESRYHRCLGPDSVVLQYTTTSWIMYLFSVTSLALGARAVLYDGSPFHPGVASLIHIAGQQKVTMLGVSPRFLQELQKNNISPRTLTDLSMLQTVTSTGMVLSDSLFEWFYDHGFPKTTQLANISGGTDLAGCFGLENPLSPVYVGGCQGPALGTSIGVFDPLLEGTKGIVGQAVADGVPGELVATRPFPNMPVKLWGDDRKTKYMDSYFSKYDNVWTQGDFVVIQPLTKGVIFLGRADGVLNPSGVRFGSAEIYSVVENAFPQVGDSICVGQRRPSDLDESVLLFLQMRPGESFTRDLVESIKTEIKKQLSPRHVPRYIFETPAIPMTINLKKVELPVKQIVSGQIIKPSGTLLNPESLNYFYQFANIESLVRQKSKL